MSHIQPTPYIKAYVDDYYLQDRKSTNGEKFHECYIVAATSWINRPMLFTVHLSSGALFSKLPIWALSSAPVGGALVDSLLQPWSCLSEDFSIIKIPYLKDYRVKFTKQKMSGKYLFTCEFKGGGFSEDPEQGKQYHFIKRDDSFFGLYPNNDLLFVDKHFTDANIKPDYKVATAYWECD